MFKCTRAYKSIKGPTPTDHSSICNKANNINTIIYVSLLTELLEAQYERMIT